MMEAPQIIYPDIAESLRFTYDEGGHYLGNTAYFIASDQTWLLGVLNSAAVEYFYLKLSAQLRGGYVRGFTQFIERIPIPNATDVQRKAIRQLVEYILFLHRKPSLTGAEPTNPRDPLAAQYLERWVNALVYQLFFPEKIASAQLDFFRLHAESSLPALDAMPQAKRLVTLREIFERLSEPTHPLRGALFALDSVPVVKAVEGRA